MECLFPVSNSLDAFLLTDMARTASNPGRLLGGTIHHSFGLGFRINNVNHPISFGLAASHEGLKLFTAIDIGKIW